MPRCSRSPNCELDFSASLELNSNGIIRVVDTSSYSPGCTAIKIPVGFLELQLREGFVLGIKKAMKTFANGLKFHGSIGLDME